MTNSNNNLLETRKIMINLVYKRYDDRQFWNSEKNTKVCISRYA